MKFRVKEWLEIYNEVKRTGEKLKNGRRSWDHKNKCWIPAVNPMPEDEQQVCEEWIKKLLIKNNLYLDACGMIPNKPLWKYLPDDPKTWASHEDFIYGNLITGVKIDVVPPVR